MQEKLELLRDLQELDRELIDKRGEKQKLLEEQETLNAGTARIQGMVDDLNAEVDALEAQRRDLAQDLVIEEGNITRAEERLPTIKTQKEYVAVLKEVDSAKKMNKEIQDKIAGIDERLSALNSDKEEKDNELSELVSGNSARQEEITAAIAECDRILGEGDDKRDGFLEELPVSIRKRYEALLDRRAGVAIVEARDGICLGCHMNLPPQLYNTLFSADDILSCPHCNRMLFLAPATA